MEDIQEKFKDTIQQVFEAEIDEHLGYIKHDNNGDRSGNSCNGYSKKTMKTKFGKAKLRIPRDRKGEYEPQIIKKYETTSNGLEDQIIGLFSKGMSKARKWGNCADSRWETPSFR
ncbi:transposase [Bacillus sp. Sa1BUA2]|uniref:Mutator family transposase n=1 Tax=Bacillus norwichensis TaxID=2762217 RepID=A0ABR8VNN5_9BACI|nr:transposase [Bacillus norwichensis]